MAWKRIESPTYNSFDTFIRFLRKIEVPTGSEGEWYVGMGN
jgi:hypothetical protein